MALHPAQPINSMLQSATIEQQTNNVVHLNGARSLYGNEAVEQVP